MHCHTAEGSPDSSVTISDYISLLKEKGFSGMLIADHDSYAGFNCYEALHKNNTTGFTVLKGIEYDTIDAGHFLVIMPADVHLKILEFRGLPVLLLIDIVHRHKGILGPAHPFGERYLSIFHTGIFKKNKNIASHFDFIEAFNACEDPSANNPALEIAKEYNLPTFGGSDSHWIDSVGCGYTEFKDDEVIQNENDLINYIASQKSVSCGGVRYYGTTKDKLGPFNQFLVQGFWLYNKFMGLTKRRKRKAELKKINSNNK